jgi:hypothetical protein
LNYKYKYVSWLFRKTVKAIQDELKPRIVVFAYGGMRGGRQASAGWVEPFGTPIPPGVSDMCMADLTWNPLKEMTVRGVVHLARFPFLCADVSMGTTFKLVPLLAAAPEDGNNNGRGHFLL